MKGLRLEVLEGTFAICRLAADAAVPGWVEGPLLAITRTPDELSLVCSDARVPEAVRHDAGWRCLRLVGPFDLNLTGILAAVLAPLAQVEVGIFAISTYDTDYVLVRAGQLEAALLALRSAGHRVG